MRREERVLKVVCTRRGFILAMVASIPLAAAMAACRQVTVAPATAAPATAAPATAAPATAAPATATPVPMIPKTGGVLRLLGTSDPRWFDSARQCEWWQWGGIYDSLLRYTPDMQLYPHLAEKYEIAPDGKSISLQLRQGVKFHSGREFTADDVEWMIKYIQVPEAGALFNTFATSITAIEKPDKYNIILRMDKPDAGMLDLLANLYIMDQEFISTIEREGYGTGPFKFVEFRPGERIVIERNEDYWGPKAYLDHIEIGIVGDAQAIVANLEAGAADLVGVPLQEYIRLKDDPRYKGLKVVGGTGITNIWLNTKHEPFTNKLVRQAINYAIDRERFVRVITMGESKPLWQPQTDNHWAHFPELENKYPFDLDKAKSVLAEAGLPNGFSTSINCTAGDPVGEGLAQILQSDLAKIGVVATIKAMDSPAWAQASDSGEFDINMHNYGRNNADPSLLFKGTVAWRPVKNPTGFDDPEYTKLIDAQSVVIDREKRLPLIKKLIEYVQDQCFVIPVAGGVSTWLHDAKIEGFEVIPVGVVVYCEKIGYTS